MKFSLLTIFFILFLHYTIAQPDCNSADYGCTISDFTVNSSGGGAVVDIPSGSNISNPTTNPGSAGNSGCLFSGELNPTWIIFTISNAGYFEFTLGSPGGNGFFDWSMWPYYEAGSPQSITGADACAEIQANQLPPVACNWNASSGGYTGMVQQGNLPAGANQGNFEHSFWANPGDQFVLMFSNYSGLVGTQVPIYTGSDIPGNTNNQSADVTCDPSSIGTTVCLGDVAQITVNPGGIPNPTFTFLNNQGDLVDPNAPGPTFDLLPTDTTTYSIEVSNGVFTDTVDVTVNVVFPPAPDAGIDFVVCSGAVGTLNATAGDPANTLGWTFTGPAGGVINFNPNATTLNPSITSNMDGVYTLTLSESNGICPDQTDDVQVTFENPTMTLTGINPDCFGGGNGEIHADAPLATTYSFDGGITWQVDSFATGFSAGNYTVCMEGANGCQTCEDITIQEGVQMTISVVNDTTICENGTATLSANATGGTMFDYLWSHTADVQSSQQVQPGAQTSYDVQAQNENGCLSPLETIVVDVLPPITGSSSLTQSTCPGYPIMVSSQAQGGNGGPYNFVWTNPGGNVVANTAVFNPAPSVNTIYTVTITDGCESTPLVLTSEVIVSPLPDVQFSVDLDNKCKPATFEISNETDPALVEETYWYFSDDQTFVNTNAFSVSFEEAGNYDLQLVVVTPDGCIDSATVNNFLIVHPKPKANFNFVPDPVTMFNTEVLFQNYSTGANTYMWTFENGLPGFSTLKDPVSTFPEGEVDNYEVELIATSIHGCTDTAVAIVQVESEVIFYAPNSFTPDGDERNPLWRVYIEGIDVQMFDLEIYNRWGELIWESHNPEAGWDATYGGAGGKPVEEGTYVWKVRTRDYINDKKYEWQGHINVLR
ncbi:MAG: gliding motility-associated C-terminal domain-containing protein [Brumimicrobium sp.]|nr:gliding motility-associated C-terminal domain-containing protein [Brumimicrobium sp.]